MTNAQPHLTTEEKRTQRERDQALMRERLQADRESKMRKKRMFEFSLLTGPGGERGSEPLGAGV